MTEISEADRLVMRAVLSDAIAWLDDLTLPVEEQLSAHEISMGLGTCERLLPDPAPSWSTLSEATDAPGPGVREVELLFETIRGPRPPLVPWPGWLQP